MIWKLVTETDTNFWISINISYYFWRRISTYVKVSTNDFKNRILFFYYLGLTPCKAATTRYVVAEKSV